MFRALITFFIIFFPVLAYADLGGDNIGGGEVIVGWREQASQDVIRARTIITDIGTITNNNDGSINFYPASSDLVRANFIRTNNTSAFNNYIFPNLDGTAGQVLSTNGVGSLSWTVAGGHDAVTLAADADTLLGLSTQQLTLDTQAANLIFAGPGSGAAADPTFRAIVDNDVPDTITLTNLTQITTKSHTALSDIGTNAHSVIDTFIASKAAASGLASLDISSLVVQNPANATATPTASKIPIADGSGLLDGWITLGASVDISAETNLAGNTEVVLTGDALSLASTITRDTELAPYAPLASPTFTGTVTIPTPFTLGAVSVLPTGTELNYVDGVTSAIQTQIDGKQGTLTNSAGLAAALNDETGTGLAVFGTSPAFTTQISTPSIITTSGALGITPSAGSNLNVNLSTTGDLAVNTNQFYVDTSAGNVGIGTASPIFLLDILSGTANTGANVNNPSQLSITGASKTLTSGGATVFINSNSNQAADTGGSIALTGRTTDSSTNSVIWAAIKGAKETAVSANQDAYLAMAVQEHGAGVLVERMRINSDGNVGIGTTTPGAKLDVQNPTDAASNLAAIFRSGDRATPANNDEGYISFYNDDSTGTQSEFSRLTWKATDVTSTSKDSQIEFNTRKNNTLSPSVIIGSDDALGALSVGANPIFSQSTLYDDDSLGHTALQLTGGESQPPIAILNAFSSSANRAADLDFTWSRGTAYNGVTVVQDGDRLGRINWVAADGVDLDNAAATIQAVVDGTPGANDTPGKLEFLTTNDGSRTPTVKMTIKNDGNVGIGTTTPTHLLDINSDNIRIRTAKTPASATDTGTQGQIAWDANYIYVCTATNVWVRAALTTW